MCGELQQGIKHPHICTSAHAGSLSFTVPAAVPACSVLFAAAKKMVVDGLKLTDLPIGALAWPKLVHGSCANLCVCTGVHDRGASREMWEKSKDAKATETIKALIVLANRLNGKDVTGAAVLPAVEDGTHYFVCWCTNPVSATVACARAAHTAYRLSTAPPSVRCHFCRRR
jgi:hypothetical protein